MKRDVPQTLPLSRSAGALGREPGMSPRVRQGVRGPVPAGAAVRARALGRRLGRRAHLPAAKKALTPT